MREVTLCFLREPGKICLAMKKTGFGAGKWNGVGGKVENGESVRDAAVRELREEIGVAAEASTLEEVADIRFFFDDMPEWDQRMIVFVLRNWEGTPSESDEMAPRWYSEHEIPYEKMWVDDVYWLPRVLSGERISAEFHLADSGSRISAFRIDPYPARSASGVE